MSTHMSGRADAGHSVPLVRVRDLRKGDRFFLDADGQIGEVETVSIDVLRPDVAHVHLVGNIVPEYRAAAFVEVIR